MRWNITINMWILSAVMEIAVRREIMLHSTIVLSQGNVDEEVARARAGWTRVPAWRQGVCGLARSVLLPSSDRLISVILEQ